MATLADDANETNTDSSISTSQQVLDRTKNHSIASLPSTSAPRRSTQKNASRIAEDDEELFQFPTPNLTPITQVQNNPAKPEEDPDKAEVDDVVQNSFVAGNGDSLTPPSKRAKYVFKRCFEATFVPQNIAGAHKILAPDSDEENEEGIEEML